jgi:hypothetical protein
LTRFGAADDEGEATAVLKVAAKLEKARQTFDSVRYYAQGERLMRRAVTDAGGSNTALRAQKKVFEISRKISVLQQRCDTVKIEAALRIDQVSPCATRASSSSSPVVRMGLTRVARQSVFDGSTVEVVQQAAGLTKTDVGAGVAAASTPEVMQGQALQAQADTAPPRLATIQEIKQGRGRGRRRERWVQGRLVMPSESRDIRVARAIQYMEWLTSQTVQAVRTDTIGSDRYAATHSCIRTGTHASITVARALA